MFSPIRIIPIVATVILKSILPEKGFSFALIFLLPVRSRNLAPVWLKRCLSPARGRAAA
jgi:hypothetical protein